MKKCFFIFLSLLFVGCQNRDINNIAIVNEILIDYDSSYIIYAKVLDSKDENQKIYIERGNTIEECFSKLSSSLSKKTYLSHLETMFFTDSIEKKQFKEIINYFMEQESSRNSFNTIIINSLDKSIFDISSVEFDNMMKLSINYDGVVTNKTFENMIKDLLNYNVSYIPYYSLNSNKFIGYKAIYDENKIFSKEESIAINFIFNKIHNVTLLIDDKNYKLENCNSSFKRSNSTIFFNIKCEYDGNNSIIVKNYITESINKLIRNNKNNYFKYLGNKYGINDNLKVDINVDFSLINRNSGDNFA